jgi:PEP-CTERM motif
MLTQKLMVSLTLFLLTASANASPLVYVVNGSQQFGTVDLTTGAFHQIGPLGPDGQSGLAQRPNGSFLTLAFSGNLDSIDSATGITSVIGPTGLGDCMSSASPCGPTSAAGFGELGGTVYATDFSNNLYTVDPVTGVATLIGPTGIPAFAFNPTIPNADGTFNIFDYSLFSAGGKLYTTFDTATIDFGTLAITPLIAAALYQIDPSTGHSTFIAPTALNLTAVVNVNGTIYGFNGATHQIVTLDLANGNTTFVSDLDPAAGLILGASPVPEPASIALTGIGLMAVGACRRRKIHS